MTDQLISCPQCGTSIPLNDALTGKIRSQLKDEIERESARKLDVEKVRLWKIAQEEAAKKNDMQMADLKRANEEKEKELESSRRHELELREQQRALESKMKNAEVELARKLDEVSRKIQEDARKEAQEEGKMKLAEKEKQLEQLQRALEEAQRKAEQGSMQVQGDAQETNLKQALMAAFPMDSITDVPTGIRGADLVHTVYSSFGQKQGTILWESKNTKAWSNDWIKKLKDDQALAKADIVIIASQVLPDDIEIFGQREGVWITEYKYALPLVSALRHQIGELSRVKQSLVGKDAKMEMLYNYLSGSEFKNRIESIVLAFTELKEGLDSEKRAMERIWNKREKEIERVMKNTVGFRGDLEGIIGAQVMPAIESLELPAGEESI